MAENDGTALPSLKLVRSHLSCGRPNAGSQTTVAFPGEIDSEEAFAIASGDAVEILDCDLQLRTTLLFSDAFPGGTSKQALIAAIAIDAATQRVAAVVHDRIAIWTRTATFHYKVHSTLSTGFKVDCLDFHNGFLIAAGESLCTYTLDVDDSFPTWSKTYFEALPEAIAEVKISGAEQLVACRFRDGNVVRISRYSPSGYLNTISEPWHMASVRSIAWDTSASNSDMPSLLTQTVDGTMRIWRCGRDEPDFYILWHTLQASKPSIAAFWLPDVTHEDPGIFSIGSDGSFNVTLLRNLHHSSLASARTSRRFGKMPLQPKQLSCFRYAALKRLGSNALLLGRSKSGSLIIVRSTQLRATQDPLCNLVRHRLGGTKQNVKTMAVSEDALSVVTASDKGQVTFWVAMRLRTRTAYMQIRATYEPTSEMDVRLSSVSADGTVAILIADSGIQILRLESSKIRTQDVSAIPNIPAPDAVLAIALDSSNDGRLHCVFVGQEGVCVWQIHSEAVEVVYSGNLAANLAIASLVPQTVSSSTRIVAVDQSGQVYVGSVTLDGKNTSHRQYTSLSSGNTQPRCLATSTGNHIAIVSSDNVLSILDTQASLFNAGSEYSHRFPEDEAIQHVAFANTLNGLPLLLVVFPHRVLILSQRRLDYYNENALWAPAICVDVPGPHKISAACMLWDGALFVASGNQIRLYSRDVAATITKKDSLALISDLNAPLLEYHPQYLMQLLLAGKASIVDDILLKLWRSCHAVTEDNIDILYEPMSLEDVLRDVQLRAAVHTKGDFFLNIASRPGGTQAALDDSQRQEILAAIREGKVPGLSNSEQKHLSVVIETIAKVESQRRSLDTNGMRFLISLSSFAILQEKARPSTPVNGTTSKGSKLLSQPLARLRYRDNLWAFFSDSQEILISESSNVCNGPMLWTDARALGLPLWIKSTDALSAQLEVIAKNEYTSVEDRDPTLCSLYYFALRKKRLVQGLWRQATFHKERTVMMKFLMNDFSEARWKSAAMKNAYALMGKHRYHYAAAFFLLGDGLKDAVGVCMRQLDDFHLAIMIARVYEGDNGPVLRDILNSHLLPLAFARGHRRLAVWAFWMLNRRDLAVRTLVTPLANMREAVQNPLIKQVGQPGQEDSSLVLLYAELRDWSLQTLRGSSAIAPILETQFILYGALTLSRMGCQTLAVELVANWKFSAAEEQILALSAHGHPTNGTSQTNGHVGGFAEIHDEPSETSEPMSRPKLQHRRRSSLLTPKRKSTIILDVPSAVQSRSASPEPTEPATTTQEAKEQREGFKRVLKEVKAPPPEFDMSSFGF